MNKFFPVAMYTVLFITIVLLTACNSDKKAALSPQAVIEYSDDALNIEIVYCQPSKKERLIFGAKEDGALQPFGQYWRLGANEATTLKTNKDLVFGSQKLAKGIISLYAVPGKDTWKLGFNKIADRWGASEPDYDEDLFTIELPVEYTNESKEQFTIHVNKNDIVFWWDTSKVVLPYKLAE